MPEFVPTLIAIGLVVSVISSLGAPLIPTLAVDFHASLAATQWSLTATMLVGAVVSPLVGRLGDGPHRRTVLLVCLGIVTVGGAIAAAAPALWVLLAGRALQGVGLALMPLIMAAARDHLATLKSGEVIATLSVLTAVGIGLGYPLTGFIAEYGTAAMAFWVGTVASALAWLAAYLWVPGPTSKARAPRLDVRGAVLIGAGLLALLLGFEQASHQGWTAPVTLALIAVAAIALTVWARNELRVDAPLVDLRLVRHPAVLTANVTGFVLATAMYLGISLITQIVQLPQGMGASAFVAGLCLIPLSVGSAAANRMVPWARRVVTPRGVLPCGSVMIGVGLMFFGVTGTAVWQAMVTMGVVGLGLGFTFAAMPGLIVAAVPPHETSSAMSFYQVSRYVGFSVGSGLAVTALTVFSGGASEPTAAAYGHTSLTGGLLCLVAAAVAWVLPGVRLGGGRTASAPIVTGVPHHRTGRGTRGCGPRQPKGSQPMA